MSTRVDQLDQLRHEVNLNLAFGAVSDIDLVTNDEGHCPSSSHSTASRCRRSWPTARRRRLRHRVLPRQSGRTCRVDASRPVRDPQPADSLIPGPDAEFGMFLDYVARHDDGVCIPAAFDHPAKARDARPVELAEA